MLTLNDLSALPETALVRVDFNMPEEAGENMSFARLERTLQTLFELHKKNKRLILLSHYGRPKGKIVEALSLQKLIPLLSEKLGVPVVFAPTFDDLNAKKDAPIVLFENVRFFEGEEKNDDAFTKTLSMFGDIYINDAFAVSHRKHASIIGLPRYLKSYAGRLLEEEIVNLNRFLNTPQKPMFTIIGGAKISSKIGVLEALLQISDGVLIGGAMANTFLKAKGHNIGASLVEDDFLETARAIMQKAQKLYIPDTFMVLRGEKAYEVDVSEIQSDDKIMDVAPSFIHKMGNTFLHYQTFLWNGPMGVFEKPPFDHGTLTLTKLLANLHDTHHKHVIAGGGDSVAAIEKTGLEKHFSYISTGGGAFLEWLQYKTLPGIAALKKI